MTSTWNPDIPLYPTESQIARRVLGPGRLDEWRGLAVILERDGLPKIDPEFGGRYWPAVEMWFQQHNRLAKMVPGQFGPPDGDETPCEAKPRGMKAKTKERPASAGAAVVPIGSRDRT